MYLFGDGGGSVALPVSFHFARLPRDGVVFFLAARDWVWLAKRRSCKARFSAVGEMQAEVSLFYNDFRTVTLTKG